MSFGDPNNPYGTPPQQPQQQPGYGYPQQAPQGVPPQQGYGYPAAPPVQQPYGGGYAAAPMTMPGGVKAARIILWVLVALQIASAIYALTQLGAVDDAVNSVDTSGLSSSDTDAIASIGKGVVVFIAVLAFIFAALGAVLAIKFANGANATRVCTIVYGSFVIVGGLFQLPIGVLTLIAGILIVVFVAKSDGAAWFKRPRY
ncbi:hypothetical protein [Streptomyces jeddahensis]|uniref:Uncharacterized protein n=1 Tax=Streptomyces jeddahensis TaxID=1716141 RepID=A0A177HQG6_9ACTN|nr:hypothetical protein [Streptomyces jeddahensis]OAH13133.1 hypothetical protein STSP_34580 [Streptomyces jeddahensis]